MRLPLVRALRRVGAAFFAALLVVLITGVPARADTWRDRQWYFGPMRLEQAQHQRASHDGGDVGQVVIAAGVRIVRRSRCFAWEMAEAASGMEGLGAEPMI